MSTSTEQYSDFASHTPFSGQVFQSGHFRAALAREFKLEAMLLKLPFAGQELSIPAFLRPPRLGIGSGSLIIGAGFDKTGYTPELDQLSDTDYSLAIEHLLKQVRESDQRIGRMELRTTRHIPCLDNHSDKLELRVRLDKPCAERLMEFSKSTRRNIRLPFRQGFRFVIDRQPELLDHFYRLYLQNMHELGSLPHSRQFFQDIFEQCHEAIAIFVGYMDEQPVVSSFVFLSPQEVYGAWSGTHPDYKQHNVFLTMLWSIVEFCEQTGRTYYNLGRSSGGSGACQFKMRLANDIRPIYYYDIKVMATDSERSLLISGASWVIRNTPPFVMNTLSRNLLHRFY